MFTKEEIALAKDTVEAIKKISKGKWEWEPEVGEFVIIYGQVVLVKSVWPEALHYGISLEYGLHGIEGYAKDYIPLLHWERIEKILEGMGYELDVFKSIKEHLFVCSVHRNSKIVLVVRAKSRQLAVTQAVIELGKESSNEKD